MKKLAEIKTRRVKKFTKYLKTRVAQGVTNRSKLYREIVERGYKGHPVSVNRFVNVLKDNETRIKPSIRFETKPGEQAQVDWGRFGEVEISGRTEKLSCFVYVLGYSRMMYVEFTIKQTLQTLQQCHINAFEILGIPKVIVYDNMKTVVVKREKAKNKMQDIYLNPAFLDFAQYYGFNIQLCPPYWPRAKGKVEAGVKYVRNNFMQGMVFKKDFSSLEGLSKKAREWLETVANTRIHGTTNKKPISRWRKEQKYLYFPKNVPAYATSPFLARNSTKDGLVQYKSNFYSVPVQYVRKKILLKELNANGLITIEFYHEDKIIAQHKLSMERGKWIIDDKHLIKNNNISQRKRKNKRLTRKVDDNSSAIGICPLSYYDKFILGDNNNG